MNKVVCYFFVFASLISFLMVNVGSASATYFSDDFMGNALDSGVWTFTQNVQGNNLYSSYGGSIIVTNSLVYLSSDGSSFPCINSKENPFPSTGDFVLEFKITYTSFTPRGDGFWVSSGEYSSYVNNRVLEMWADSGTTGAIKLYLLDNQPIVFALATYSQTFDLRLEYLSGIYTLYNNGVQLMPPVASASRPNYVGFGHPQISSVPFAGSSDQQLPWTSFNVDYIRVFQAPTLVTPEYPIGTIMCVASAFGAFAVFSQLRKRKANRITTL
jgi:hypothetical protein